MFMCFLVTCNYDTAAEHTSGCRLKTSDEWFQPFLGSNGPLWIILYLLMSITAFEKAIFALTFENDADISWPQNEKVTNWERSRAPDRKSSPPHVRRNRKTALGVNMLIYSLMPEKDATPVRKKTTHSNWQQGVHKERIESGVWQKRVK